jgi:hypothetical protein
VKSAAISGETRKNLKDKINEITTNSKTKNIRDPYSGINECKKGYQLRSKLMRIGTVIC